MVLHDMDAVVARRDIDGSFYGGSVQKGTPGVVLRKFGADAAIYRAKFRSPNGRWIVLNDLTDEDICAALPSTAARANSSSTT